MFLIFSCDRENEKLEIIIQEYQNHEAYDYKDYPLRNGFLVMCEVLNPDGSPHESNGRATIDDDDDDFWFGFEQEYFLWNPETNLPLGFPKDQTPQA